MCTKNIQKYVILECCRTYHRHSAGWRSSKYAWWFRVFHCFSVWQLLRTSLHARWSNTTLCPSSLYLDWESFLWSVDWALRTKRIASVWFIFVELGQGRSPTIKTKKMEWNNKFGILCHSYFLFLMKKCWVFVFQAAGVCAKCRSQCWNLKPNGSERFVPGTFRIRVRNLTIWDDFLSGMREGSFGSLCVCVCVCVCMCVYIYIYIYIYNTWRGT